MTVLLIEDDDPIASMVQAVLEDEGYRVLVASDGITGLAYAREHRPDLILSNIMLPGLTGQDIAKELHADPATARIPVVLMSAASEPGPTGLHTAFVRKPFTLEDLITTVAEQIAS